MAPPALLCPIRQHLARHRKGKGTKEGKSEEKKQRSEKRKKKKKKNTLEKPRVFIQAVDVSRAILLLQTYDQVLHHQCGIPASNLDRLPRELLQLYRVEEIEARENSVDRGVEHWNQQEQIGEKVHGELFFFFFSLHDFSFRECFVIRLDRGCVKKNCGGMGDGLGVSVSIVVTLLYGVGIGLMFGRIIQMTR